MRRPTPRERLLNKAIINWRTGCWEWAGNKDSHGYGRFSIGSRQPVAHRAAYELIEGPIAAGLQLDHLCRVRHCINPAHLQPVTALENVRRVFGTFNTEASLCRLGHPMTPDNTYLLMNVRYCRACNKERVARYKARRRAVATKSEAAL